LVRITFGSDIRGARFAAVLATVVFMAGCGIPYVAHVSYGQARILVGRVTIEDRLADPSVSEREKAKLKLVLDAKAFAQGEIGLAESTSYSSVYDTEGDPVAWNLSACADTAFLPHRWTFPILGSLPYKGYFTRQPAVEEARELRALQMDVLLWPVSAYSTLGWFSDPLFTPMLDYSDVHLANTIFHELAHATIFIDKDADFNETLATFIGNQGAVEFFEARGGRADPRLLAAADEDHDDKIFIQEIARLRAQLVSLYASCAERSEKLRHKARIFDAFRLEYQERIRPRLRTRRYDYAATELLNNAWILALERYHGDLEIFGRIHAVETLREIAKMDDPRASLATLARE
jgi:predicted aminopeptidase